MSFKNPKKIPIFPLYGIILLPKAILPLRIFEPRYLQMLDYTIKEENVIGMIQPEKKFTEDTFKVGCLGFVKDFQKIDSENYLLNLKGLIRFKIKKELEVKTLFRQFEVDYSEFSNDENENISEINIEFLRVAFEDYLHKKSIKVDWKEFEKIPINELVNFLCMNMEFSALEKQALLESKDLNERCNQ